MKNQSLRTTAFNKNAVVRSDWQWKADRQPEDLATTKDYIDLAHKMVEPALDFAMGLLAGTHCVEDKTRDKILKKLTDQSCLDKLYANGVAVKWRVKTVSSAEDKLFQDKKTPDDIGDYLGIKLIAKTVEDVKKLREAILCSPNITSRKCEFSYPSKEGYRSHKSHHRIEADGRQLSIEIMITHAEFESIEETTHAYIDQERDLLRKIKFTPRSEQEKIEALKDEIKLLKAQRITLNYETAQTAGLNELCAEDAIIQVPKFAITALESASSNMARSIFNKMAPEHNETIAQVATSNGNSYEPQQRLG